MIATDPGTVTTIQRVGLPFWEPGLFQLESYLVDLMALEFDSTGMLGVVLSATLLVILWLNDFATSLSTNS